MSLLSKIRNVFVGPRVRGARRAEARRQKFQGERKYGWLRHKRQIKVDRKVAETHKLTVLGQDIIDPDKVWVEVTRPQLVLTRYFPSARRIHRTIVARRKGA